MRILVVDDSKSLRTYSINMLKRMGLTDIHQAEHGADALKQLDGLMPVDLITLDINMPFMDGISCLKHIRSFEKYNSIKIFMVTSESEDKTRDLVLSLGANDILLKPFSREALVKKVKDSGLIKSRK